MQGTPCVEPINFWKDRRLLNLENMQKQEVLRLWSSETTIRFLKCHLSDTLYLSTKSKMIVVENATTVDYSRRRKVPSD